MSIEIEFSARKDIRGNWGATTDIPIGDELHVMRVSTHKVWNGEVVTDIMCGRVLLAGSFAYTPSEDYNLVLCRGKARCTEGYVRAQHAAALETIVTHIKAAKEHYK